MILQLLASCLPLLHPTAQDPIEEARSLLDEGALDDAIAVLEQHLEENAEDATAWSTLGEALQRMWQEGGASFLIMDEASQAWHRAVDLAPFDVETLQGTASMHMAKGEYTQAAALGLRAIGTALADRAALPDGLAQLVMRSRMGVFLNAEHEHDKAWGSAFMEAWNACRGARALVPEDSSLTVVEARFLDGLGLPHSAIATVAGELEVRSDDVALHRFMVEVHAREGLEDRLLAACERLAEGGMNPTLAWYTGYAHRLVGDAAVRQREFAAARASYRRCMDWMRTARVLEPTFEQSATLTTVQALVSTAWCHLGEMDVDSAWALLFGLIDEHPELLEEKDGLGRTAMDGLSVLGADLADRYDFARAAEVSRRVLSILPEDGGWWNNLGFLLREYGTQIEEGLIADLVAPEEQAERVLRESWNAYLRAIELIPDDPRLINDTALIQVYHLADELELAEELLHRAIRLGEEQLEAMGPDPLDSVRFPVAQAVGDAYENLGYLYYHLLDRPEESRAYWLASIATDSGEVRIGFQEYVDAIDGKRGPVPERDNSFMQAPLDGPPEPVIRPWEGSLADAEAIAEAEGRPLVLLNRGDALGHTIPFLDEFVISEGFGNLVQGAVLAVADGGRHNFVDRTRDGRRLECPTWGTVTCAEHIRTAEEFGDWYRETHGEEHGESEEGLWHSGPGAEDELTPMSSVFQLLVEEHTATLEASAPLDLSSLEAAAHEGDALPLVRSRHLEARRRVAKLLFEGSQRVQVAIVTALREDGRPGSLELLDAAIRQDRDPELALLALDGGGSGDFAPIERAALWSTDERVRAAADKILTHEMEGWNRRAWASEQLREL